MKNGELVVRHVKIGRITTANMWFTEAATERERLICRMALARRAHGFACGAVKVPAHA